VKRGSVCGAFKPPSDFHRDRSRPDGLQHLRKACCQQRDRERYRRTHVPRRVYRRPEEVVEKDRAYRRAWYYRNRTRARDSVRRRRAEVRAWLREYKTGLSGALCGESDAVCLDFHHADPAEKDIDLAQAVSLKGWSIVFGPRSPSAPFSVLTATERRTPAG
jgi:hypothetical protein